MLDVRAVSVRFAGLHALDSVSLTVRQGEIHALIGPNGAGKTTLFNVISGVQKVTEGSIAFAGRDLTGRPLWTRAAAGIARTFQNIRLFADMSVLENVMCGFQPLMRANPVLAILGVGAGFREETRCRARALELLDLVGLAGEARKPATSLSYGHQRRVEIARALASAPKLLLLDEPAAGMNPSESLHLAALIKGLQAQGLTMLVVEHDLPFLMRLSDRMTVLASGRILAEGKPLAIRNDPRVIEAYLGSAAPEPMKAIA
jgi:branched-chain amino acid transport system ATP-binding protein